jgi:hypothetical protein
VVNRVGCHSLRLVYGVTVRVVHRVVLFRDAEIITTYGLVTTLVVTAKVAWVLPTGIAILAGTVAAVVLLLARVTTNPAVAGPLSFTVAWEVLPPTTMAGLTVRDRSDTGPAVTMLKVTPLEGPPPGVGL